MFSKNRGRSGQADLFLKRTKDLALEGHPLVILSKHINWKVFEQSFGPEFHLRNGREAGPANRNGREAGPANRNGREAGPANRGGRPGLSTRLMAGLHYLQRAYNLSDEAVLAFFTENPQWQYFCGQEHYTHVLPCDPSGMTLWRKRTGPEKLVLMLKEITEAARRLNLLKQSARRRPVKKEAANTPIKSLSKIPERRISLKY